MSELNVRQMLDALCRAAEKGDGKAFAAYFAEDGVYHDDFYGSFVGREGVAKWVTDWLHKDARALRWDMMDPVFENGRLYTRYIFSYDSKLPEAKGERAMYEAVAIMSLRDGKITEYREVVNSGTAFADMGFHPERLFKIFARKAAAMKTWPEAQRHLRKATA
jgi:ketosteroid isomerase-like protein